MSIASAILVSLAVGSAAQAQSGPQSGPPRYTVDPTWPKQLPNNWILGQVGGLSIDQFDHIWVLQRPLSLDTSENGAVQTPQRSQCCVPAPSVLEFDQAGNVIQAWGGPNYVPDWPATEHGILVDKRGFVWVGGNGAGDRQLLKFTNDGKLVLEIGHKYPAASAPPENNQDTSILGQVAQFVVDDAANEIYVADGYLNKRVVVYDTNTGAFKRGWGAYGQPLSSIDNGPSGGEGTGGAGVPYDPNAPVDQQFRNPVHCINISREGYVYVCDRVNDRYQVFTKQGQFLQEVFIRPATLGNGSVWDIKFSHDPQQRYLLIADGENNVVWEVQRATGNIVGSFGHGGHQVGQFHWVHVGDLDSLGNYYEGEVDVGKRVQRFILQSPLRDSGADQQGGASH